ncbi:Phage antitermination protein Q [Pseudomonas putida]|uniref:antiterminator Q family protein n=1 Tax=Pseudomonas guariconensis TaxID=1288410 RepID=UPI001F8E56B6|nr:antiterminator Q family protein [Pseudomonas guariconensis]CAB5583139.1 Phage antitermination protein Q [Pseudomonas putida]MDM9594669.1 antiterminator Q family protein [Pseudomonas guariconensis]MDM9607499.1 antiterminator Q family protein [Pseudomonas guariconensis]CAB5585910.1 Phage antitermination protein Q [Pseudomonas putida]CAB5627321.1 Phage antitermination protein Q [Pseudomonas putida]
MSHVEKSAEYLLEHWGRWVVLGSGVSCCASRENTILDPMIADDDALMIDRLVGRLLKRYPECGKVIMKYYTSRHSTFKDVSRQLKFGEEKARQLWKAGVAWIDGALESRREAA